MKKIRIKYKNVMVPAYENEDGVIGKICVASKTFQPIEEFGTRRNGEFWYLTAKTMKESAKQTRVYRDKNPKSRLFSSLKNRARRLLQDCDIETSEDLSAPEYCPILGLKIDYKYTKRTANSPSIDRIDNSKGYTKDNIVVCCWRANRLKSDASFEELEKIYQFVKSNLKKDKA